MGVTCLQPQYDAAFAKLPKFGFNRCLNRFLTANELSFYKVPHTYPTPPHRVHASTLLAAGDTHARMLPPFADYMCGWGGAGPFFTPRSF